jgi:hypothetical protein
MPLRLETFFPTARLSIQFGVFRLFKNVQIQGARNPEE